MAIEDRHSCRVVAGRLGDPLGLADRRLFGLRFPMWNTKMPGGDGARILSEPFAANLLRLDAVGP